MGLSTRLAAFRARANQNAEDELDESDALTADEPEGNAANAQPEERQMANDTPLEEREDYLAGLTAGRTEATSRMSTVFAHENAQGREAAAAKLLGKGNLSAEDITDILVDMPKAAAIDQEAANAAAEAKAEETAREEMQKAMKAAGTKELGTASAEDEPKPARAKAAGVWERARAKVATPAATS